MSVVLAFVIGTLYAAALYMMLRRHIVKLVIGLTLLSHGSNLLIFTAAGLVRGESPLISMEAKRLAESLPDPLPQALILTAIVINFGLSAFTLVLVHRTYETFGRDDLDRPPLAGQ